MQRMPNNKTNDKGWDMASAHLVYIADVYCPWCFGFGPIMKRIAQEHPEFPITVYGGNLMSTSTDLQDYAARDPGLLQFWQKVEATTGRSLAGAINALTGGKNIRMYSPGADLILTALNSLAPGHDLSHMLYLEDMFYGQGKDLFTQESAEQIAKHFGMETEILKQTVNTPHNEQTTERHLEITLELMGEITSYPSVLLIRGSKVEAVSRGYVHYETVEQRLIDAMQDLGIDAGQGENCTWHGNCGFGLRN